MQPKYAQYVEICKNMHIKYAHIFKNTDSICKNMQKKYAVKYAKHAEVHILHILHIYAHPTLLMMVAVRVPGSWAAGGPSPCRHRAGAR